MGNTPPRILIFEDHTSIQTLLKYFFQKYGYETLIVEDGTRAMELVSEFKPDLIIMDVIMPGKGGIETCTDLRREGVLIPIIMLTSKSFPGDSERGLEAGANAYLIKPFKPKELLEAIRSYLPV